MKNNNKKSFIAIIPEVYFDCMSRVTPGAIFILGFFILKFEYFEIFNISSLINMNIGVASGVMALFLLVSWFLGIFFSAISHLLLELIRIENIVKKYVS